ncbi:uncharacterized protein AB675_2484 [Cyphellophora attinorum]|uniref:Uncharacterized protein n=1 Tax=Cyphellophora attinorum TaxID=1664694 RepID=A0A0N1HGL1_9EURO|nr:uncharacterized protein AB675_2484 [Phialophora attinorum]KPI45363.1 hypothetical protein AB675_2484 [Phialophora attinorum]
MASAQGASRGTVADRIRAFQGLRVSPEHVHVQAPKPISRTFDPEILISHGRRKDSSVAAPVERPSLNAVDGFRGGGRPSVAPSSSVQATTSSDQHFRHSAESHSLDDPFIATTDGPASLASRRSDQESHSELDGARARLRPVDRRGQSGQRSKNVEANTTLAELGFMIDDALGERTTQQSPGPSPKHASKPSSVQSPGPESPPQSTEPFPPRIRPFTIYRSNKATASPPLLSNVSPARGPEPLSLSSLLQTPDPRSPEPETHPHHKQHLKPANDRPISPVKEKAAMFESLSMSDNSTTPPKSPPPRVHLRDRAHWKDIRYHSPSTEEAARKHRAKFGHSISEHHPDTSEDTEAAYNTASETPGQLTGQSPPRSHSHRAPSRGWPAQLRTSSKTGRSEAQFYHEPTDLIRRDVHNPSHRPSIVAQRIAQLALAGLEDLASERSRTQSPSTVDATPGRVRESELRNHNMDGGLLLPNQMPEVQIPVQEQADYLKAMPGTPQQADHELYRQRGVSRARTQPIPVSRPVFDKLAIGQQSPVRSKPQSGSPITPVRGRALVVQSPRGSGYGVEQSFYFSARKSRSPSRGSGRKLTLQINLGSPDHQSMERVSIKADMDELEEA